jgi:Na+/proline symporter
VAFVESGRDGAVAFVESGRDGAAGDALRAAAADADGVRKEARELVGRALPSVESRDTDYVFLSFVLAYVPRGLLGLLIAVILCAAMSSVASELIALSNTSALDLYQRLLDRGRPPDAKRDLFLSKLFVVVWGALAIAFASFASLVDNLIQAVNIIGSLFYGTLLGLFVVGLFVRRVTATPVLIAALVSQAVVAGLYFGTKLGFLWYNVIGTAFVVGLALVLEGVGLGAARR